MGHQYLLHIGGDRGPIETIDLTLREDIVEIFGADVCHTHQVDTNGYFELVFLASKEDAPMDDLVSVGAIGAVDILRLGPLGDT